MFRFLLYITFFVNVATSSKPKSYDGSQVLLIPWEAANLLKHQFNTGDAELWRQTGTSKEIFVNSRVAMLVRSILDENHVKYTVLVEDVQKAITKERFYHKILEGQRTIEEGFKMSWDRYHRTKDIYNFTDQLAVDFPKRVQIVNIGKSFHGRLLKVAIFKSGMKNAKKIWLDGGIHAREWVAPAAVTYIMRELAKLNASDGSPLSHVDFYVCPVLNPDGYEYSHTTDRLWRKNRRTFKGKACHGIDLNRNFQARWKRSKKCNIEYAGAVPFSEPETRHMSNFIKKHLKNMEGFITFHSFSQVILYPYAYPFKENSTIPNSPRYKSVVKVGERIADQMSKVEGHRYKALDINHFTEGAYGSSVDWAMDVGISYPYAIELRPNVSSEEPGFLLPPSQIIPTSKEAFAAVTALVSAILDG
uniref:Carboxypeptidase A6 n=1 Tax=Lygus hesperus TaxID=30085 RepID=A0A0A9VTY9_LYGHE